MERGEKRPLSSMERGLGGEDNSEEKRNRIKTIDKYRRK
jgi:hypothetical protein